MQSIGDELAFIKVDPSFKDKMARNKSITTH